MQMELLLLIFSLVWITTHLWILPFLKNRWRASDLKRKVMQAGSLATAELIRDFAVSGVFTMSVIILSIYFLSLLSQEGDINHEKMASLMRNASGFLEKIEWMDGLYNNFTCGLVLFFSLSSLIFTIKRARNKITKEWHAHTLKRYEEIVNNPEIIDEFRNREEYQDIINEIDRILYTLQLYQHDPLNSGVDEEKAKEIKNNLKICIAALSFEDVKLNIDIESLLKNSPDPDSKEDTTHKNIFIRLINSDQFYQDLGLLKKPLSFLMSSLLILSLITIHASSLANSARLALNNLEVNIFKKDTQKEIDKFITYTPPAKKEKEKENDNKDTNPLTASQEQTENIQQNNILNATRYASRYAVNIIVNSNSFQSDQSSSHNSNKSEYIRAAILKRTPSSGYDIYPGTKAHDNISDIRNEVYKKVVSSDTSSVNKIEEHVSGVIGPEIEKIAKENPSLFKVMLEKLEARYTTSMSPVDAQGYLLQKIIETAIDQVSLSDDNSVIRQQAEKIVKEFGSNAIHSWVEAQAKMILVGVMKGRTYDEILADVRQHNHFKGTEKSNNIFTLIKETKGKEWIKSNDILKESSAASSLNDGILKYYKVDNRENVNPVVSGYDDLFPDKSDDDLATFLPEHDENGGGSGGGSGGGGGNPSPKSKAPSSWTKSFRMASISSRVRGVLIGQDQEADDLNITDIRWTLIPAQNQQSTLVTLSLQQDQAWHDFGPFPAAIVNQALRYAADERVVAVTITPGDRKLINNIVALHPSLIDTPLGCRIIESDMIIDGFTSGDVSDEFKIKKSAIMNAAKQGRLSFSVLLSIAQLQEEIIKITKTSNELCAKDQLEELLSSIEKETKRDIRQVTLTPELKAELDHFIREKETSLPGSTALLRSAAECAEKNRKQLPECICNTVNTIQLPSAYWIPVDHTSQVREKSARLDKDFHWLERPKEGLDAFDFHIHTTLILRDSQNPDKESNNFSTNGSIALPEKELKDVQDDIKKNMVKYVSAHLRMDEKDFLDPLVDFVLVQRLLRAALSQKLGENFPMAKLIELERATASFVPYQPTLRWSVTGEDALEAILNSGEEVRKVFGDYVRDVIERNEAEKPLCDVVSK